jgi:hypothetical protein
MLADDSWMVSPSLKNSSDEEFFMSKTPVIQCADCHRQFSFVIRKHNCRKCGHVFCGYCSRVKLVLKGSDTVKERICNLCCKSPHIIAISPVKTKPTDSLETDENKVNSTTNYNELPNDPTFPRQV